jgi:CBS domain-containing protein
MAEAIPLTKLVDFLRTVPPFHLLSNPTLEDLVRTLVIEYFPKGETILSPEGPPTQFLYIIRSGGVKIILREKKGDRDGDEKVFDFRDDGEFFGLISLLTDKPSPFKVVAEEDTLCYLIRKEILKKLLDDHPDVQIYFTGGPSKGYKQFGSVMSAPQSTERRELEVEQVLFTGRVREVMRTNVLTCPPEETVVGVARRMTTLGVGSAVVVDDEGIPTGIVTDRDFRSKILATGKLSNVPVMDIMSRPVQSILPDSFCFEAILAMITHKIKYLTVMDGLNLLGIVAEHDLMVSQGNNPVAVIKGIQQASTIEQVVAIRKNIDLAMRVILQHGGMAKDICELITTLNDHLTQKIIVLAEEAMVREGHGLPPVPYSWIALGSEGRREQTLRTDQDNAILFSDVPPEKEEEVQAYFLNLAEKVVSGLEMCGFPRCKGGIMAINPKWCQPYRVWTEYFRHWLVDFDYPAEEILQTFIFFDFRPIYGQFDYAAGIQECIRDGLNTRRSFLRDMAETAVLHQPPLGFFKKLVVEKSGEHKNKLNLKLNGLTPLVDAIRTLALDQEIFETNTLDRLEGLVERGILPQGEADDLRDAFNVIMLVRVRHHVDVISRGGEPDNYVNPDELSIIQRTMLKEAFKAIDRLQSLLEMRYSIKT